MRPFPIRALCAIGAFAVLAAGSVQLCAQERAPRKQSQLTAGDIEAVERVIRDEMARQRIPGLSVAVGVDQRVVFNRGFGRADVENDVPASEKSIYRLASVSKPFTATAAMQLVEEGKLDLDAPVQTYVSGFPAKRWPVTPRHLITNTSGIRHYRSAESGYAPQESRSVYHYQTLMEPLHIFQEDPLLHRPGERLSYSSYGFNLLGAVVEGASGVPFVEFLQENIFEPAGLETIREDDWYAIIPHRVRGYLRTKDGLLRNATMIDTSNKIPSGGLCSRAEDLTKFGLALLSGVLLSGESVQEMFAMAKANDGSPIGSYDDDQKFFGHGLGWWVTEDPQGRRLIRYGGSQPATRALIYILPDQKVTVGAMCNLGGVDLDTLAGRIAEIVLAETP